MLNGAKLVVSVVEEYVRYTLPACQKRIKYLSEVICILIFEISTKYYCILKDSIVKIVNLAILLGIIYKMRAIAQFAMNQK